MFSRLTEKKHVEVRAVISCRSSTPWCPRHVAHNGYGQHRRRGHGHCDRRPRRVLDVGQWPSSAWRRCSWSPRRPDLKVRGKEGEFRAPSTTSSRRREALAGHPVRRVAHPVLRVSTGCAPSTPSSLEYHIPDYATNGAGTLRYAGGDDGVLVIFGGAKRISAFITSIIDHGRRPHRHRGVDHHRQHRRAAEGVRQRCSPRRSTSRPSSAGLQARSMLG